MRFFSADKSKQEDEVCEVCVGKNKVVPLGRLDSEALVFVKHGSKKNKGMWVLGENLCQAFGFIPKWVCHENKVVGVAVREDRGNKGNLFGLCKFIYEKHGYKVEYQVSPKDDVQKAIDLYFSEYIPKSGEPVDF